MIITYKMEKSEIEQLRKIEELNHIGYQYTIMYMSRIHSQAEFIFSKILALLKTYVF